MIDPMGHSGADRVSFNYEHKLWGANEVGLNPRYLNALRLKYCLVDLSGVSGRVLEVGCGAGGMARAIKRMRPDLDIHGCDISRAAVSMARSRNGRTRLYVADAQSLPYGTGSFDVVVAFDVLEHLSSPESLLLEIYRVLRPDGILHCFVPCEGGLISLHGILARVGWCPKREFGGHIQLFTASALRRLLEHAGFSLAKRRWSEHLAYQVSDMAYFSLLALRRRNALTSVESQIELGGRERATQLLRVARDFLGYASYFESWLLRGVPGLGVHITCRRPFGDEFGSTERLAEKQNRLS